MSRVAVVSPNSLVARELRERLAARLDLFHEVRLLSADENEIGQLAESGGAAAFVGRLDDDALEGVDLVFFCGTIADDRPWLERLPESIGAVVLSRGASTAHAAPALAGRAPGAPLASRRLALHPAAYGAALLLARLEPLGLRAAQAVALLPVSAHDDAGLEALFEQTRALLSFRGSERGEQRGQLAFNVALSAADADDVGRQVGAALGSSFPFSLQLVDAGVFHGVGLSLRVELAPDADVRALRRALDTDPRIELARKPAAVSPAALAGSERLMVGEIRPAGEPGTFWIWAVFDNLIRGGALAAIDLAEELLAASAPPS